MMTPSKVRFEVEDLRRLRLITESDTQSLLEAADVTTTAEADLLNAQRRGGVGVDSTADGRENNTVAMASSGRSAAGARTQQQQQQKVFKKVMEACSKIREAKSRVSVGLLEAEEYQAEKRRLLDGVKKTATAAPRRERSFTRQILATVAEQKAAKEAERAAALEERRKLRALERRKQEHPRDGGGGNDDDPADSGGDFDGVAPDQSLDFLREMGVELSTDDVAYAASASGSAGMGAANDGFGNGDDDAGGGLSLIHI